MREVAFGRIRFGWLALLGIVHPLGCSGLPNITPGECGNAVLEFGEDCDTFVDPALGEGTGCNSECRYTCEDGGEAFVCPMGWGCGVDNVCRHGEGSFAEALGSPYLLPNQTVEVADMDGDNNPDLVGLSTSEVSVRFGSGQGQFVAELDFPLGARAGVPFVANMDDADGADVLAPLSGGLFVGRGTTDRQLLGVTYAPFEIATSANEFLRLFPVTVDEPWSSIAIAVGNIAGGLSLLLVSVVLETGEGNNTAALVYDDFSILDIAGRIPRADVDAPGVHTGQELVLPIRTDTVLRVLSTTQTPGPSGVSEVQFVERQSIPLPGELRNGALFADVNGNGFLDIVLGVRLGGETTNRVAVAFNNGAGGFAPAVVDNRFDVLGAVTNTLVQNPAQQRWPLASGDFDGNGLADFVSPDGLFVAAGGGLIPVAMRNSPDPWLEAVVADFHGDGMLDVAAVAEATDGVDFFIGTGGTLFNRGRIDTISAPFGLRVGDFDGDLIPDLSFAERDSLNLDAGDTVSVMFGQSHGSLLPPTTMGRFQFVLANEPMVAVNDLANLDQTTDLLVQSNSEITGLGSTAAAVLLGATERRMLSPFALVDPNDDQLNERPLIATAGRFDASKDNVRDVIAFSESRFWLVKGTGDAQFSAADTVAWDSETYLEDADLRFFCSLWTVGDLNNDGTDELIGVDNAPLPGCVSGSVGVASHVMMLTGTETSVPTFSAESLSEEYRSPKRLRLADINFDGFLDAIVVFGGERVDGGRAASGAHIYWNREGVLDFAEPTQILVPEGGGFPNDLAPLNADVDPQLELALLTEEGVYLVDVDADGVATTGDELVIDVFGARRATAADVNRDGAWDLVISDDVLSRVFVASLQAEFELEVME